MFDIRLGTVRGPHPDVSVRPFAINSEDWFEHTLILGRTGTGKSRLINQIVREHLETRTALVLIDPDSDLVEDVLGYAARRATEENDERILKRIHLLEPSPFLSFRYDPFHFALPRPVHPELLPSVHAAWLHCKVQRIAEILQRNNGQVNFEGMPRLHRVLTNVLYGVGMLVEDRHLPLSDAAVLLSVHSREGQRAYRKVARFLPREVRADFELLAGMQRVEDLRRETESTINRLRSIFGPVVQSVFGADGREPAFNLFDVIQKGHVVLVSLRDSPFFSGEQSRAIGTLMIYDALTTAMITPREMRRPCTLVIDEAAEYATPDLSTILRRGRKYKFAIVLGTQSVQSFKCETYDLRPVVLGQPKTIVVMQQRWPEDLDLLARVLFTGEMDFTPLVHEVERDGGIEWVPIEEHSLSKQTGKSWGDTNGSQETKTNSVQEGWTLTEQEGWQQSRTSQQQHGGSQTVSEAEGKGSSRGMRDSPVLENTRVLEMLHLAGSQQSEQRTFTNGHTSSASFSEGETEGRTGGTSRGYQDSSGASHAVGWSASRTEGGSEGEGRSVTHRLAQVHKVVRELQRTGQLEMSVADQLMQFAQKLFMLKRRQAIVLSGNEAVAIETVEVPDPFVSPEALARACEWIKRRLVEYHPYLFVPDLTPEHGARRLEAFLTTDEPEEDAPEPLVVDAFDPLA
jgi:hypothetical protein